MHGLAAVGQCTGQMASDETVGAGDPDGHGATL
jgi:hypothetical protein